MLATEGGFYSLPVPPVAHSRGNVQRLPIVPQGRVLQLDFDPLNNSVLWVESGSNMLHRYVYMCVCMCVFLSS